MGKKEELRILVIDDSDFMRKLIADNLKKFGYKNIKSVSSGEEGLKVIDSEGSDVVFLDINMYGLDGLEVLKQIKENYSNTICIIVSALDQKKLRNEANRLGAAGYISKPFADDELAKAIENNLKRVQT
ncbi:MAG: response regulator transcription factor [Nanoarchaeota archaeon]